ncbi:ATP-binding protein [Muriicola sp.]|uniref:ATP-binding protein n=1 Tax=Muriicola sp. TaxID=2020856 RepID=UPI003C762956
MKLTKKTAGEIMQVHEAYWAEYLKGNVEAMAALLDSSYTQVGSAESEVFYTKKEAVQFLHDTIKEVAGKLEMRNRKTSQESQDGLALVHEICDLYALDGKEWIFYSKFRATTLLREKKEGWKLIHQHSSFPDSKTDEGQNVAIDKIAEENRELREAVKRRTTELEHKNRELEIEASLERIRAQAMAMRESADLLDIVVTLRNEFIALGHEAHYFWHMRWLPEIYEKAMTSGDGTRIGMVMELPRHIHGDIPLLAKWEKGKKPTVIYAMDVEAALDYVDKMVTLGDFQQLDPNAPTEEDIRHIGGLTFVMSRTTHGEIGYSLPGAVEQVPEEDLEILVRFAGAFDLAHKRFEDLKKSEQQAREVQVELALEKVRSRTMGMQESSELKEVVKVIFDQLAHLSINAEHAGIVVDYEPKKDFHFWVADNQDIPAKITVPYLDLVWDRQFTEAKKKGQGFFTTLLDFEEKNSFYKKLLPHIEGLTKQAQDFYFSCPGLAASTVIEKDIGLYIENFSGTPYSGEENDILRRFAKVFQQTYTRFLDLQKAESQAREAQIENALEKVRSRTMAMQKSHELPEAANNLFLQVQELGIPAWSAGYCIWETEDKKAASCNMSSEGEIQKSFILPTIGEGYNFYDPLKKGETFYIEELGGDALVKHYEFMRTLPKVGEILEELINAGLSLPTFQIFHILYFPQGYLMFITYEQVPEAHDIFKRFAKVFEQTYTRFLDLQKAEAQAREAQIEAALERARAQSMMMQHSDELNKTSEVFHDQLTLLGIDSEFSYLWLPDEENNEHLFWATWQDDSGPSSTHKNKRVVYPLDKTEPSIAACYLAWESGNSPHVNVVPAEDVEAYFATWTELLDGVEKFKPELFPDGLYYVDAYMKYGCFGIVIKRLLSDNEQQVLRRFSKEFERAYTRFLDLQKAEAQAKEAQIEAALERVRAKSMAMHKSEELAGLSLELVKQVQTLGVKTWFCAFNIYDDDPQGSLEWGSNGQGTFPRYRTPREGVFLHYYDEGHKGKTLLVNEIGENECAAHYEYLCSLPGVGDQLLKMKDAGIPFPTSQIDHVAYFKYGYILFITFEPAPLAHDIFKRFAKVFEQTYTRFLDLQKAEELAKQAQIDLENLIAAKKKTDEALTELKATQSQLIQSEKMASLGELTAGIAHEIQNPLNFVNNFSEVSKELIEEMLEEMEKGDVEEVKALAKDIIQNLDKIYHHGQRADGIVKGMLQHSRTSSGEKELTDINMLADEYLRLAYHGLRAKDKSFNAALETHFDESIGMVNIIPQDMGRVILNLITNAFYVVRKKKEEQPEGYEPTVTVSTKKTKDGVKISVKDNGNGIPEGIKEKIFQPFFTTKPTGQGTGLGLSMSYDIVTKGHGGELKMETKEGEGTVFTISLKNQ